MPKAVVVIQEFETTLETYEQVNEKLGDAAPAGLIVHTASNLGEDKWKVVDVWESEDDFQRFAQEQLIPAIAEVNPDAPQADIQVHEVRDLIKA
jgi:hypothetical protein